MATRIKIKRGTTQSIIANKDKQLEENEIVYSTNHGMLGIKSNGIETADGIVWFLPKETYNVEIGNGATNIGEGYDRIIIGNNASSSTDYTVVVGSSSSVGAYASYSTAIGPNAKVFAGTLSVPNNNAIAIGYNAQVTSRGGIVVGSNSKVAGSNSIIIGNDTNIDDSNIVQLGKKNTTLSGFIGDRPIDLQGDIEPHSWSIPKAPTSFERTISLYTLFDSKPIGTIGLFLFQGRLESAVGRGLRIMKNASTSVTSINSTSSDNNARFSFKIIKTDNHILEIYAFAGEGHSAGGLKVTYDDISQQIYGLTSATINFKAGGELNEITSAKLMIKFI